MKKSLKLGFLELLILKCLELHGYAPFKDLEHADADRFQASEGRLCPVLACLEREGLIKSLWVERLRYYKLGAKGRKALATQKQPWNSLSEAMTRFLSASLPGGALA